MIFPRFTIRTILAITTAAALLFVLVGAGYRGQNWAWAAALGILSLLLAAMVQAACFALVWCFAQLATRRPAQRQQPAVSTATSEVSP